METSYENEDKIIWLKKREDLGKIDWVKETVMVCAIRTGPVKPPKGDLLIGYAVLKKDTAKDDEGGFRRRIFTGPVQSQGGTSLDHGIAASDAMHCPISSYAVDPLSVQPGKPSRRLAFKTD